MARPFTVAVRVTFVETVVVVVGMVKVTVVAPAGTTTVAGGVASAGLLLVKVTVMAVGATASKVTVPIELVPPTTVSGFNVNDNGPIGRTAM